MSNRSRIGRLAESLQVRAHDGAAARPPVATARAPRVRAVSRAFDDGAPAVLATLGDEPPSATGDVEPGPLAAAPAPVASAPEAVTAPVPPAPSPAATLPRPDPEPDPEPAPEPAPVMAPPATPSDDDARGWTVAASRPAAGPDPDPESADLAFAEDIQAILAHSKGVAGSSRVPLPPVPSAPPTPVPPAPSHGIGMSASHDIFDQMAAANAPHRFDQGPVSLSVDFDRLDRALESVAGAPSTAPGPAAVPAAPEPVAETVPPADPSPAPAAAAAPAAAPTPSAPTPEPPERIADVADVAAITGSGTPFRVVTDVPLIPQGLGLSCHAAACASMVAWRDEVPPDGAAVAAGTGYWEKYADGRTAVHPDVADAFGLATASVGTPPAATALRELLDVNGPLFVTASPPGEHAVVVSGATGDGTASGTIVDVVDPWAAGMTTYAAPNPGSRSSVPWSTLLESIGSGPHHHIVVAHLRRASS